MAKELRLKSVVVLVAVLLVRSAYAEPPTLSPVPLADDPEAAADDGDASSATAPVKVKKRYGLMIALVDVLGAAGLWYGLSNIGHLEGQEGGEAIAGISAASLVLMSPLIHGGHGNGRGGVYSFLLRAVLVPLALSANEWAGLTTLAGVAVFDWVYLAEAYPRKPGKSTSRRLGRLESTGSISLVPTVIADGPGLVLGGRF